MKMQCIILLHGVKPGGKETFFVNLTCCAGYDQTE